MEWAVMSSPRDLSNAGIEPGSPASQVNFLPSELQTHLTVYLWDFVVVVTQHCFDNR